MQRLLTIKLRTWLLLAGLLGLAVLIPFDVASAGASEAMAEILYFIIINFTGWLLWMGGVILDFGVNTFVINFGTNFNSNGVGEAVNQLWVVVRDFFNILFIFGLVYIGFKMILNSDDSRTKSTLVSLIIAALLINFSLFITKFVVDFTNTLAAEVATAGFETSPPERLGDPSNIEIGNTFFHLMGLTNTVLQTPKGIPKGTVKPWSYIFGIGIINIIGAFAFGVGGIMLIIRFVVLSIYMVLSPFMFLGMIFPGFQSMSSKYWSGFFKQAFYAPVYIVMIFFSATILNNFFGTGTGSMQGGGITGLTGDTGVLGAAGGQTINFGGGLAPFILSAAFLIAAVQVAGKLSADGSGAMAKVGGFVNSRVQGAVRGGVRFGARNTIGLAGSYTVNKAGEGGRRGLNRVTSRLAQQNWAGSGVLARGLDKSVGAGLDRAAGARVAGSETAVERRTRVDSAQAQFNTSRQTIDRSDQSTSDLAILANAGSTPAQREAAQTRLVGNMRRMNNDEVMNNFTDAQLQLPYVAQHLTDGHLSHVRDSGRMNNAGNRNLGDIRTDARLDSVSASFDDATASAEDLNNAFNRMGQTLRNMSQDQRVGLGRDRLTQERVAVHLTDQDITQFEQSGRYSPQDVQDIRAARTVGQNHIASGTTSYGTGGTATVGAGLNAFHSNQQRELMANASQAGRLPAAIFANPSMAQSITPAALVQRENNGLSTLELSAIQTSIQGLSGGGTAERALYDRWVRWAANTPAGRQSQFNFT